MLGIVRNLLLPTLAALSATSSLHAAPSLEDYAAPPEIRNASLSGDGTKIAWIRSDGERELLCSYELSLKAQTCYAEVTDLKPRSLYFAGKDHVILRTSARTLETDYFINEFEFTAAFSVDLATGSIEQLPQRLDDVMPQGLGRVIGVHEDGDKVFMPAFTQRGRTFTYDIYEVRTNSGSGRQIMRGTSNTKDWIIAPSGDVLARESMDDEKDLYTLDIRDGRGWKTVIEEQVEISTKSLVGLTADGKSVIVSEDGKHESNPAGLYPINLETGDIGPALFPVESDMGGILLDRNRVVTGVRLAGMTPGYFLLDEALNADVQAFLESLPSVNVELTSWSDDYSKLLFHLTGAPYSGHFAILDRTTGKTELVARSRPGISSAETAEVISIEYPARDGLMIPALVTFPLGTTQEEQVNLPMIVMPHGGPESHDQLGFDWMAQFFASRGYMVLQPNFRGSTGFGLSFLEAGYGEWGKAMQDDVTDGMNALAQIGWANPERVCIVGWSYGGFSALSGGAKTPDSYQCVVSIAGVSDLPKMLFDERWAAGEDSWVMSYWERQIGNRKTDRSALEAVSPAYQADAFTAPVLLIHGRDDVAVPIAQSTRMRDALEAAGKDVELIIMKDQDHSLSTRNARVDAMKAIIDFVDTHIGTP